MKCDFRGFKLALRQVIASGRADTSRLTCRAQVRPDVLCGKPATWMLTAGCVHEHVVPSLACDEHAEQARALASRGLVTCTPCKHGSGPHSCRVLIEYTALAAVGRSR